MATEAAAAISINILVVIDTDYVLNKYPNPSQDPTRPTGIDHNSQYMIGADPRGIVSGQGTADLAFKANAGDFVSFRGTSIYQNADAAVIVYGIRFGSGTNVFNNFVMNGLTLTGAAQPDPRSLNGLPALKVTENFSSLDSRVAKSGTENFLVDFALYTLDSTGQKQNLKGYYTWDPRIIVS